MFSGCGVFFAIKTLRHLEFQVFSAFLQGSTSTPWKGSKSRSYSYAPACLTSFFSTARYELFGGEYLHLGKRWTSRNRPGKQILIIQRYLAGQSALILSMNRPNHVFSGLPSCLHYLCEGLASNIQELPLNECFNVTNWHQRCITKLLTSFS